MSETSNLPSLFVENVDEAHRDTAASYSRLAARLTDAWEEARSHFSAFAIPQETYVVYMANAVAHYPPQKGWEDWFDHLHSPSLYLACGCVHGLGGAVAAFESIHGEVIDAVVRRFQKTDNDAEDLGQIAREKLLVNAGQSGPKLQGYAGQGFLENWLRVTVARICLDVVRVGAQQKREHELPDDALQALPDNELDIELAFLKREYRDHFKTAFTEALRALSSRDRNLLRQHLVSGLSIDQMATIYHIHRATAARRLASARQALLDETRKALMERLSISAQEFDSIMGLIQSRLDVSMHRMLAHASSVIEAASEP